MRKVFNTDGYCDPELHYMVDLSGRLNEIRVMVDAGQYFTVNRARQYGKTTILRITCTFCIFASSTDLKVRKCRKCKGI